MKYKAMTVLIFARLTLRILLILFVMNEYQDQNEKNELRKYVKSTVENNFTKRIVYFLVGLKGHCLYVLTDEATFYGFLLNKVHETSSYPMRVPTKAVP
jgi:hypothetical protein